MVKRNNDVPKQLTFKFKTNLLNIVTSKKPSQQEDVFSTSNLPLIPPASSSITSLLLKYNSIYGRTDRFSMIRKRKKGKRHKTFKKINGFFAFRSFYSASIPTMNHQRELSIKLGKIWTNELDKKVWNTFADNYNVFLEKPGEEKLEFLDWLSCVTEQNDIMEHNYSHCNSSTKPKPESKGSAIY